MDTVSRLCIKANVGNLAKIRNFVQQSTSTLDISQEKIDNIILAVDEAVTNIITHGYGNQPGLVEIEVKRDADFLILCLKDQAPSFDPTQIPPPDLTLPLEKRPLGKYGIHLIRNNVDEVIYEIPPEGGNQLTLVKNLSNF